MGQDDVSEHARALSAIGARKGGKVRAARLTSDERQDIARRAAEARWQREKDETGVSILKATHGTPDHPLRIGNIEIPCYVLEDGTRVLSQRGLQKGIGMSGSGGTGGAHRTARFVARLDPDDEDFKALAMRIRNPILFRITSGRPGYGFEATILADICEVVLKARDRGLLLKQQRHIADQCEILMRGFARVGIIALVDEATGYQEVRSRQALEQILDKYIRGQLGKWAKTFPDEFYKEMFRLRGWQYTPLSVRRPQYIGHLTNDIVYARLAPGVLDELRIREPKDSKGRRKHKLHQWLTDDVGNPRLREHLAATIALMRASRKWDEFSRMLQRAFPKVNTNLEMQIDDLDK